MRKIIYADTFDKDATALGGMRAIDLSMEPIIDGLYRNPYGFRLAENDWVRVRYAIVQRVGATPALIVTFEIDGDGNVILHHVEEYFTY